MCRHRKSAYYATAVLREKLRADEAERDIVSETVEEALSTKKRSIFAMFFGMSRRACVKIASSLVQRTREL